MSRERRIELVDKLVDQGLTPEEQEELDRLQREPWELPIDVKNEIRMAALNERMIEGGDSVIKIAFSREAESLADAIYGAQRQINTVVKAYSTRVAADYDQ